MQNKYRNGDLVNVKHIGGCRIVKIEKQPDGTMCYLLKKGAKLFAVNSISTANTAS